MKYVLYRFPDCLGHAEDEAHYPKNAEEAEEQARKRAAIDDSEECQLLEGYTFPVASSLCAVEEAGSIYEAIPQLQKAIRDELAEDYQGCFISVDVPGPETYFLEKMSDDTFDYEIKAIVQDNGRPQNSIIYFGVKVK